MVEIVYLSEEKIIELNYLVLSLIKVKKADKAEVLSYSKIAECINQTKLFKGDVYDKASVLMKSLIKNHAFASGNRRTAFIATKLFLFENNAKFKIPNNAIYAKIMLGIREDYYSLDEITNWIKNGKIREFNRS